MPDKSGIQMVQTGPVMERSGFTNGGLKTGQKLSALCLKFLVFKWSTNFGIQMVTVVSLFVDPKMRLK